MADIINIENQYGKIEITANYFSQLVGNAALSCFGVVGMVNSGAKQGIRSVLWRKRHFVDKGVTVSSDGDGLIIDLHIILGMVNISATVNSIVHKVSYTVKEATGLSVKKVNVFVDSVKG